MGRSGRRQAGEIRLVARDERQAMRSRGGGEEGVEDRQRAEGHEVSPGGGLGRVEGQEEQEIEAAREIIPAACYSVGGESENRRREKS